MTFESNINTCPTDEISAYIDGELDTAREMEFDLHLTGCDQCLAELNEQKHFLRSLDVSLGHEREIELPANFTKFIVANAESTVSGLRRPRERFNALFICAGLLLFVLFAMGAEAGKLFQGLSVIVDQTAAVGSFFGHLIYSVFVGVAVVIRAIAGQFRFDVVAALAVAMAFTAFSLFVSRKVLRTRRA
jgi:anti-sigma factor RsiW